MGNIDTVIKNLKESLARPIGNPKMRAVLEAKLKSLEQGTSILKA